MALYLGYYRAVPAYIEDVNAWERGGRSGANPTTAMTRKVERLVENLPVGCTIIGSYGPAAAGAVLGGQSMPGVQIVETTNPADLRAIALYYRGFLEFQWTPAISVGSNRQERASWAAGVAEPAAARA
jgi:hypothetical protein